VTVASNPDLRTNTFTSFTKEHPHVQILKLEKVYPPRQQKNIEVIEARPEVVYQASERTGCSDSGSTLRHVAIRLIRRVSYGIAGHFRCAV